MLIADILLIGRDEETDICLKFIFSLLLSYMYHFVDILNKIKNLFTSKITSYSKRNVSHMYSGTHSSDKENSETHKAFSYRKKI